MPDVVGVRFKPVTKIYYFDPDDWDLDIGDRVIVETSRGIEMGAVVLTSHEVNDEEIKGKLKPIIRQATPVDLLEAEKFRMQEPEAMAICEELVKELDVPIKTIKAEYSFDGARLVYSFVAEQRVDFRDLVKALTRRMQTRIELKQVGARDETKMLDGYGRCGRQLCCSSWLLDFHPVSIRMAKNQDLPLAPTEISGVCGRLLCCLAYENDLYAEIKDKLPGVGSKVQTAAGENAMVKGLNVIKETLLLQKEDEEYLEVSADEITVLELARKKKKK